MAAEIKVIGVGMTAFTSPGKQVQYTEFGPRAIRDALYDAGADYADIDDVFVTCIVSMYSAT
jgi:arginase family enzyme